MGITNPLPSIRVSPTLNINIPIYPTHLYLPPPILNPPPLGPSPVTTRSCNILTIPQVYNPMLPYRPSSSIKYFITFTTQPTAQVHRPTPQPQQGLELGCRSRCSRTSRLRRRLALWMLMMGPVEFVRGCSFWFRRGMKEGSRIPQPKPCCCKKFMGRPNLPQLESE